MLAAARVVEVIAREGRAPVLEHPDQPPVGEVRLHLILGQVGQAEAGQRRVEHQGDAVEHELPLDPHPEFAPALLELPGIERRHGSAGAG